ncbi:hypothetical protein ACFL5T_04655, partial [Gemmatimonadota bacterium]
MKVEVDWGMFKKALRESFVTVDSSDLPEGVRVFDGDVLLSDIMPHAVDFSPEDEDEREALAESGSKGYWQQELSDDWGLDLLGDEWEDWLPKFLDTHTEKSLPRGAVLYMHW